MVQQVVAWRDGIEHLPHSLRGGGLVLYAHRLGARGCHCVRDSPARASMYPTAASNSARVTSSTTPASPIPTGSTNRFTPPTFFLSPPVAATSFAARSFSGGSGP